MSRIIITLIAAAATLTASGSAQAFHPFDEAAGYQIPERLKKRSATPPPATTSANRATPANGSRPAASQFGSSSWGAGDDDEDDRPARPQSRGSDVVKGPPVLDGGGRPSISPATPPIVRFPNTYGTGSVIIDTSGRALYYVLSSTSAYKYPISVGRIGFTWTGTERITRVASWPDWRPPAEMKERQPGLPDLMTGGVRNPLGARALYLGNSLYRIHGTNDTATIGQAASSGCFRMMNSHVIHLSGLAGVGTTVRVINRLPSSLVAATRGGDRG